MFERKVVIISYSSITTFVFEKSNLHGLIKKLRQGFLTTCFLVINVFYRKPYGSSKGAQWLSGRVLDSRPKGRGFEPHCVVVLEQDTFILA